MEAKAIYTREDMAGTDEGYCGFVIQVCRLCDGRSLAEGDLIKHDESCPFKWPEVIAVQCVALTKPRGDICTQCAADGRENCVVASLGGWKQCSHQKLLESCGRYSVDHGRM